MAISPTLPLIFLLPIGILLVFVGSVENRHAVRAASIAFVSIGLGVIAFGLTGFGLQFGGVGLVSKGLGLETLTKEWTPLGLAWGLAGLDGFGVGIFPRSEAALGLYAYFAAWAGTATLLPILALAFRVRSRALIVGALFWGGLVFPLAGNWIWGGGWLEELGQTLGLGHGTVDFAGGISLFLLGGFSALGALFGYGLRRGPREMGLPIELPRPHLPILMIVGLVFSLVGLQELAQGNPLVPGGLSRIVILTNLINATAAGSVTGALYGWLVSGEPSALLTTRGALAGMIASSVSLPFVAPGAALIIGGVAGLLVPLTAFVMERGFRLDDSGMIVGTCASAGLWGAAALGLFATGQTGQGWNGTGVGSYLGRSQQGVTGLFAAPGTVPDMPGQLIAQLCGGIGIGLFALLFAAALFSALRRAAGLVKG